MTPEARAEVARGVDDWALRHGLTDALAPVREVVLQWVSLSAPPGATTAMCVDASLDLALCFFLLDDRDDEVERADFARVLSGAALSPEATATTRGRAVVVARFAARGRPMARYLGGRARQVEVFRERARMRREPVGFDAWLSLRETSIFVAQWVDGWEVLLEASPTDAERARPEFARALRAACRWNVLRNEVASFERDRARGEANLVAIAMRDGASRDAAEARVLAMADDELTALDGAVVALEEGAPSAGLRGFVDVLRSTVAGCLAMYERVRPPRYATE